MAEENKQNNSRYQGFFSGITETANEGGAYSGYFSRALEGDAVGSAPGIRGGETTYRRIQNREKEAEEARIMLEETEKATGQAGIGNLLRKAVVSPFVPFSKDNPFSARNLIGSGASLAKTVFTDPKESARSVLFGLGEGISLGATDWLARKMFIKEFEDQGFTEKQALEAAESFLMPEDPNQQAIRGGAEFAGIMAPWALVENLMAKGVAYAAPAWLANHAKIMQTISNIGAFNTVGQIEESFKPEEERNRALRAGIDTGLGVAFPLVGLAFRRIIPTKFRSSTKVSPTANQTLVKLDDVVNEESLLRDSQKRLTELEAKDILSSQERALRDRLRKNIAENNIDDLFKIQQEGLPRNKNLGNANSTVTITRGSKGSQKELTVATNDLKALQNYIKGSNEIDYRLLGNLGKDLRGNKIVARHEFNPTTGKHTIYATDRATATDLAHELGHFFDKKISNTVDGLSRAIAAKDRGVVEDVLSSFAVARLGGKGSSAQITKEVNRIVNALEKEVKTLASIRKGAVNEKPSEAFADAVSQLLTSKSKQNAPVLSALLEHASKVDESQLFSKAIKKTTTKKTGTGITQETKVTVPETGSTVTVTKDIKAGGSSVRQGSKVSVVSEKDGLVTLKTEAGKEFTVAKDQLPTTIKTQTKKVTEAPKLDRTPTGRQPKTDPIDPKKLTASKEVEKFVQERVIPNLTGKERIGKTNQEILDRSLSSKLTEKEFNQILNKRFGNLAEDVTKAKRLMNDRIQNIRDGLIGKDINNLSPKEMKQLMTEYNQLVEMFEVFSGVRTELSNSFRSLGIKVAPGENEILRNMLSEVQRVLGKEKTDFGFLKKAVSLRESDIVDKYFSIWYPAILSGPKTTSRNIVGTGSNLATETTSTLFTKEGRESFVDRTMAIIGSQKESLARAKKVLKGEEKILTKFNEAPALREPDFKGKFAFLNKTEYVGNFLNAQDIYFSNIAGAGELAALRRGGYTYGLTDKTIIDRINRSVAEAYGQRVTYRNPFEKTLVGELGRFVTAMKNTDVKGLKAALTHVMPFVRTIANVTDRKIDYMPILNLWRTFDNKIFEQRANRIVADAGITGNEAQRIAEIIVKRLKDQQMGKFYMGLTVTAAMVPLAMEGRITGAGPKDKKERDTLMASGWRPNSIILPGGVVLPYQNLGPLAGPLSAIGNIADGIKYNNDDKDGTGKKVGEAILSFLRGELDQSFMSGLSTIYDLVYGFVDKGEAIKDMLANAIPIPALWTQTKDFIFPERFEAKTFTDKIKNKLGITGGLEPKLDVFGNQIAADLIWGLTPKFLNTNDPVLSWMDENNIFIGKPNKKQTIRGGDGETREMEPEEYTQFLQESGEAIYDSIERAIQRGTFNGMSKERIEAAIASITRQARLEAKSNIEF